jgi:uncharacterized protein YdaU (DUF1376 family)
MDYWVNGRLPDDDAALANITKLTPERWLANRPVIIKYFDTQNGELIQNRIESEKGKAEYLSKVRSVSGSKGGSKTQANNQANAQANEQQGLTPSQSPSPSPLPPQLPSPPQPPDSDKPTALPVEKKYFKSAETFKAYSIAYEIRYKAKPVRNTSVSSKLCQFVDRVGVEEAPLIAAYFVSHNNEWYVKNMHQVGALLQDAEKLRTEWATNTQITSTKASQSDKKQTNLNVFQEVANVLKLT